MVSGRFTTSKLRLEGFIIALIIVLGIIGLFFIKPGAAFQLGRVPISYQILWLLIILVFAIIGLFGAPIILSMISDDLSVVVNQISTGNVRRIYEKELFNESDPFYSFYQAVASISDRINSIFGDLDYAVKLVTESIAQIKQTSQEISKSSESISQVMEQISIGAQEQVKEVHQAMNAMENLDKQISLSMQKISDSLDVLDEITEETNLLALNASIEAERAGDYGKGFAVVAKKVRELADQSKEYSDQIVILLEDTIQQINNAKEVVEEELRKISDISENTAAGSEEVSASAEEQAASLQELVAATTELHNLAGQLQSLLEKLTEFQVAMKSK